MKKISFKVAACFLSASVLFSSCYVGQYSLFNSYVKWQTNMTDVKIVNAIVGFIIGPIVGSICLFADTLVLNTIEFWSGSNPLQASIGKTRQVIGQDGRSYAVTILRDGYEVKASNGEVTLFTHDAENDSWWMEQNGVKKEIFRFNADGTIHAIVNGTAKDFSINEDGVYQARMAAGNGLFFAMN